MEMKTSDLVQTITDLATPLAASLGLAIWGVDVIPAGRCVIRVFAESLEEQAQEQAQEETRGQSESSQSEPKSLDPNQPIPHQPMPNQAEHGPNSHEQNGPNHDCQDNVSQNGESHDGISQDGISQDDLNHDDVNQPGITIDQCAELSRLLGLSLEVEDFVDAAYVLEVSSPGLERLFFKPEQVQRALGAKVEATLLRPLPDFPGRKKFIGTVLGVAEGVITLSVAEPENAQVAVPWELVKKLKQLYVEPEKYLPGKSVKNTRQKKTTAKKKK